MKKMLFLMVVGFGGAMLVKGGHVTITPENQLRVAGYNVPLPVAVQNSPVMGIITTLFMGQLAPATQMTGVAGRPGHGPRHRIRRQERPDIVYRLCGSLRT